jgi:hypothetical protein
MECDEHATFPPLPGDRHPSAGHSLPYLRPHPRLPARQHQRGLDRALPPGPSRSSRHPRRVTSQLSGAGIPPRTSASSEHLLPNLAAARQRSLRVVGALVANAQRVAVRGACGAVYDWPGARAYRVVLRRLIHAADAPPCWSAAAPSQQAAGASAGLVPGRWSLPARQQERQLLLVAIPPWRSPPGRTRLAGPRQARWAPRT